MPSRIRYLLIAAVLAIAAAGVFALWFRPPAPADMAPHKALYDLRLVSASQGAGIAGLKGTMYYAQNDACDAWTSDQRFTMTYQYPDRPPAYNTNRYAGWEAKDGKRLEFNSAREENGRPAEDARGTVAPIDGGALQARYTRPTGLVFDMPKGAFLPTAHTQELIRRARRGEKIFTAIVFDGTDSDGPLSVTAVIGRRAAAAEIGALVQAEDADMALLSSEAWRIRLAAFPLKDAESMTPSYEMDMVLHANGVVSHALVDYRTFKVEQKLKTLRQLPPPDCP